jgi:hypothetical protein
MSQIDYIRIPVQILQDSNLCDKQKMLLGLIISFSEKGLMMSNGELGKLLNSNAKYIGDLINNLQAKGFIEITARRSRYRKVHFQKNLTVLLPELKEKLPEITGIHPEISGLTSRETCNITKGTKKNIKELKTYSPNSQEFELVCLLFNLILQRKPDFKQPDLQNWAKHIDLMIRSDNRNPQTIKAVIEWCQSDNFWQNNILSTDKLRKQFDRLELRMTAAKKKGNGGVCDLTEERFLELTAGLI